MVSWLVVTTPVIVIVVDAVEVSALVTVLSVCCFVLLSIVFMMMDERGERKTKRSTQRLCDLYFVTREDDRIEALDARDQKVRWRVGPSKERSAGRERKVDGFKISIRGIFYTGKTEQNPI